MRFIVPALLLGTLTICSATAHAGDPKYVGDVLGRALSFTGLEGHVGLWTGSQVIEMTAGGMVYTALKDFKTAGKDSVFYGSKGAGAANRNAIPAAALAQRAYSPTYTGLAEYWPGGVASGQKYDFAKRRWVSVTRQFAGKFRCDTLVNYAYRYGGAGYIRPMTEQANNEIVSLNEYYVRTRGYTNGSQSITPKLLYGTLPVTR